MMFGLNKDLNLIIKAYPANLEDEVRGVLNKIDLSTRLHPVYPFSVIVGEEILEIPYRVYYEEDNLYTIQNINSIQSDILHCLFSRHHNGYIREKCLRHIVISKNEWIAPFVIRLLGEYVIEILYVIKEQLGNINRDIFKDFLRDNLQFYELNKQRVISYWNCYYRAQQCQREQYVGFQIIEYFDNLIKE